MKIQKMLLMLALGLAFQLHADVNKANGDKNQKKPGPQASGKNSKPTNPLREEKKPAEKKGGKQQPKENEPVPTSLEQTMLDEFRKLKREIKNLGESRAGQETKCSNLFDILTQYGTVKQKFDSLHAAYKNALKKPNSMQEQRKIVAELQKALPELEKAAHDTNSALVQFNVLPIIELDQLKITSIKKLIELYQEA